MKYRSLGVMDLLAASGPSGGDRGNVPDVTNDPTGGPEAGQGGDTPGMGGAKSFSAWE